MVKNLPLLIAMLLVGCSALTISLTAQLPQFVEWLLLVVAVVLNTWSAIALVMHVGLQKVSQN
ncbi:hypothetical protein [Ferdinandcohnia sp. Marseille-Q9671]